MSMSNSTLFLKEKYISTACLFGFRIRNKLLFILAVLLVSSRILQAQSGSNDATFNPADVGFGAGDGINNTVMSVCIQADGKILAGGAFSACYGSVKQRM